MTSNTATKMSQREQRMRNPKASVGGPKLVIAIGTAPTMKPAKVNNSKAVKIKK